MKNSMRSSLIITLVFFLTSCATQASELPLAETISNDQLALHVLVDFLESLHDADYEKAAQLYGGTYETMIDHNPSVDSNDHPALLRSACTINGAQCLHVQSASLEKNVSDKEFVFKGEFVNTDGTLFVVGPCCGGSETDFPPQSVFYFTVMKSDENNFKVMDMPPYMP